MRAGATRNYRLGDLRNPKSRWRKALSPRLRSPNFAFPGNINPRGIQCVGQSPMNCDDGLPKIKLCFGNGVRPFSLFTFPDR